MVVKGEASWHASRCAKLLKCLARTLRVHQHYVHGACFKYSGTIAISVSAHGDIGHTITVKVPEACDGRAKVVAAVKGESNRHARRWTQLLKCLARTIRVHQHYVHGANVAIAIGAHSEIGHTIAVKVPEACDGTAKPAAAAKGETNRHARHWAQLLKRLARTIQVHQHYVHGARISAAIVIITGAHSEIRHTIAVKVPEACDGPTESFATAKCEASRHVSR
eukprot:CAMPEP_0171746446 /NCGR_PEP_ID=MMETSP0991-20121206/38803_1 /TAXON_ID=483369 /ORGANISM="non described non described, Strain CCMP2098" /LENGTH=221 /DNA_ID=CAMNT_0012346195 /DNA_START=8 /DNA_END=673 /DNA_ORIENTATION=+